MPRRSVLLAAVAATVAVGCGADRDVPAGSSSDGERPDLVVSAASSLSEPLTECAPAFDRAAVRLSFAGSDALAAQIRQGLEPDVFASANTALPDELHREGRVGEPVVFASNALVLAVPADSEIDSLADVAADDVAVGMGSESVPIGLYTREVLGGLPPAEGAAILANVRTNEPDVKGIVGKLAQGAVDAGFVYRTDVAATGGELRAIELPRELQPTVGYGAAVVNGTDRAELAADYVVGLTDGPCADALEAAGFELPPP